MKKNVLTLFCITLLTLAGFPLCSNKKNNGEAICKPISENLPGKWTMTKSYEKKYGEWKEITYGIPDEGWHEYTEQGTFIAYSRQGDDEHTADPMQWKANAATDTVSYKPLDSDKVSRVRITLEDDRTMYVFYSVNFDPATGEMREGEYRDLLLKD